MRRLALALACAALVAPAPAEDSVKDSFKKIEKGAGQLLEGAGHEVKKAADAVSKGLKKEDKKPEKPREERK